MPQYTVPALLSDDDDDVTELSEVVAVRFEI